MANKPYTISTLRPFKGLRTSVPVHTLDPGEFAVLTNFNVDKSGALLKRKGLVKAANSTHPGAANQKLRVLCLAFAINFGTRQPVLVVCDNNQLFLNVGVYNSFFTPIPTGSLSGQFEWAIPAGSITNPYYIHGVRRNGVTYAVNILTAAVTATAGPQGTMNCVYKGRMWVINSTGPTAGLESRLYFSAAGNYSLWTAPGGFIDINPGDGQGLISLQVYNDTLYIFKEKSIYALDASSEDQTTYIPRLIHPTIGSAGRGSVQLNEGFMYFYSMEGVYRTDGTTFEEISEPIRDLFQKVANSNDLEQMLNTEAVFWDQKYLLNRKTSSPHLYVFDTISESWSLYNYNMGSGVFINGMVSYPELQNDHMVVGDAGGANGGFLWSSIAQVDWYRDATNGQAGGTSANNFDASATLNATDLDAPGEFKRNYWNALDLEGTTADDVRLIPSGRSIVPAYQKSPQSTGRLLLRFPATGINRYNTLNINAGTVGESTPGPLKIYGLQTADMLKQRQGKQA